MEENEDRRIIKNMFLVTIFEFILSISLIFILSLLLCFTDLKEEIIQPAIIGISTFCIMLGGLIISIKIKRKGIIFGALQGIIYMLFLYLISSIVLGNFSVSIKAATMICLGIVGGAIGGIIGVNIK